MIISYAHYFTRNKRKDLMKKKDRKRKEQNMRLYNEPTEEKD